jgi:MFS family permease
MNLSLLAAAALANGLLIGLIPTIVDAIKAPLKARLNVPDERMEWFGRLFYLAWLPAMPMAGWLLDALPNREILFFGLIALILGVAWLALARTAFTLLLTAVFLGVAYSAVTTATIHLMTVAFFPDWITKEPLNIASLNLGFMAVGAGTLLGPWIVRAIERWWGARQGLLFLAIALIAPAAVTALCDRSLFPKPPETVASWHEVFTHQHQAQMALVVAVILIYFALENCLEFWPDAYLKEIGYEGAGMQIGLFIFWLAFIATRGAAAWWLYWHPTHGFILTLVLLITSAVVLGVVAEGFDLGSGSVWFWLLGACYGPILPGLLGIALDLYHQPNPLLPSSFLGLILALSGFDTLVMRPVMAFVTKDRPARNVMRLPTILAIVAGAALLVLAFIRDPR